MSWRADAFAESLTAAAPRQSRPTAETSSTSPPGPRGSASTIPAAVDRKMLRRYLAHLATRRYARRSIARKASTLRRYFAWLVHAGVLSSDPSIGLSAPTGDARLPHVLRHDELHVLLDAPSATTSEATVADRRGLATRRRDDAVLELLYGSGLRVSELCSLSIGDLDLPRRPRVGLGQGRQAARRSGERSGRSRAAVVDQRRTRCAHGGGHASRQGLRELAAAVP